MKGLELWNQFSQEFLRELRDRPPEQITQAWNSLPARTALFLNDGGVLHSVARDMGMNVAREYLNVDAHFKKQDGYPRVFVEVENYPLRTAEEMEKLCYVRSPLKVLITVAVWPNPRLKELWLRSISDCAREWLPESPEVVYGFAVGEAKGAPEALYYHLFAVSATGQPLDEEKEEYILEF